MFCSKCGNQINANSKFCNKCGATAIKGDSLQKNEENNIRNINEETIKEDHASETYISSNGEASQIPPKKKKWLVSLIVAVTAICVAVTGHFVATRFFKKEIDKEKAPILYVKDGEMYAKTAKGEVLLVVLKNIKQRQRNAYAFLCLYS